MRGIGSGVYPNLMTFNFNVKIQNMIEKLIELDEFWRDKQIQTIELPKISQNDFSSLSNIVGFRNFHF